jgi:hypothetical protein
MNIAMSCASGPESFATTVKKKAAERSEQNKSDACNGQKNESSLKPFHWVNSWKFIF